MKGFTSILSLIFVITIAVTAVYTYGVAVGVNEAVVKKISIEKDIYLFGNALDYSKLFLDTSIKYATYQSLSDYGSSQEYWDNPPTIEDFKTQISEKIQTNLNKYTVKKIEFVDENHKIQLPKYNNIDVVFENNILKVKAEGDKIQISQNSPTEKIDLSKESTLVFETPYILFDLAKNFVSSKKLENQIQQIAQIPTFGESKLSGCDNKVKEISDIDVFNSVYNTSFSSVEEAKNHLISQLIDVSNKTVEAEKTSEASFELSVLSSVSNLTLNCEIKKQDKCDTEKTYSYIKTCVFDFKYALNFSITLTDLKNKYPVESGSLLDKKTKLENQKLTFKKSLS